MKKPGYVVADIEVEGIRVWAVPEPLGMVDGFGGMDGFCVGCVFETEDGCGDYDPCCNDAALIYIRPTKESVRKYVTLCTHRKLLGGGKRNE